MTPVPAKRLLCVFAHPDDESYGPGGTIAQATLDGVEVRLLMFTCGEAGSIGISRELDPTELCRRRRGELADACRELDIISHRILGVPDKGVAACDPDYAVNEILSDIRRYRPQIVLTFHRAGVSGHPDHIAVQQFLLRAMNAAGEYAPQRMVEWGIPSEKSRLYERPNLQVTPPEEVHIRVTPSADALDRKVAAIRAHVTQVDFFHSLEAKFDYRAVTVPECFTVRRGELPAGASGTDLFEGISEDRND